MSGSEEDDLSPIEDDLEIIEESEDNQGVQHNNDNEVTNENQGEGEVEDKKEVKTKRVRNAQPKLNADRLRGPRGLQMIEGIFKDVKFKGRGCEEEDLSVLMKTYEYWCHRLYPRFPFDACLERMEKLGTKKLVQTYIKRIRMNLLFDDDVIQPDKNDSDNDAEDAQKGSCDDLLPQVPLQPANADPPGLTEEQLERIRINRERAQRLRQQNLIGNRANNIFLIRASTSIKSQNNSQESQVNFYEPTVTSSQSSSISEALKQIRFAEISSSNSEPPVNLPADSVDYMSVESEQSVPIHELCTEKASVENMSVISDMLVYRGDTGSQNSVQSSIVDLEPTASQNFCVDETGDIPDAAIFTSQDSAVQDRDQSRDPPDAHEIIEQGGVPAILREKPMSVDFQAVSSLGVTNTTIIKSPDSVNYDRDGSHDSYVFKITADGNIPLTVADAFPEPMSVGLETNSSPVSAVYEEPRPVDTGISHAQTHKVDLMEVEI